MANYGKYPEHIYASMFPLLIGQPFSDLVADIKKRGQLVPAVRYKGKTIDGRNRVMACVKLGIKPVFVEWRPPSSGMSAAQIESELLAFVISMNLHRRQLSWGQRAMIAADYYKRICPDPLTTDKLTCAQARGAAVSRASLAFEVSNSALVMARNVAKLAPPKIIAGVRAGELSLSKVNERYVTQPRFKQTPKASSRARAITSFRRVYKRYHKILPEFNYAWDAIKKTLDKVAAAGL